MARNYGVAVVFGGASNESEVSVITGALVCNVLKKGGESVLPVYIDGGGKMRCGDTYADISAYRGGKKEDGFECVFTFGGVALFKKGRFKGICKVGCVLNCCHGSVYEGGAVVGAAQLYRIPCASAGLFESAAFLDKYYTKLILNSLGVKVADYVYSQDIAGAIVGAEKLGYPVIVKPATLGSSVGIEKVDCSEKLLSALDTAFLFDSGVLIERYLSPAREINCAVYFAQGEAVVSPCEEAFSSGDILSYDDKYCGGGGRRFPAELCGELSDKIRETARYVYTALNMRGIVRFDFLLCGGETYLSEINTVPGSLSNYLISQGYADFYKKLCLIIGQAKADFAAAAGKRIVRTGILNNLLPMAGKLK